MQVELKHIQREVGVAFVYVTHDQEEALTMSDKIAVMNDGRILQTGQPAEIYDDPANLFVARFIGSSNVLPGKFDGKLVRLDAGAAATAPAGALQSGEAVVGFIRPEKLILAFGGDNASPDLRGVVTEAVYLGASTAYRLALPGDHLLNAVVPNGSGQTPAIPVGTEVSIGWAQEDCLIFRSATGERVRPGSRTSSGPPSPGDGPSDESSIQPPPSEMPISQTS